MTDEIPTSKRVFLSSLSREEQLGTLFDWCQSLSSHKAQDTKEHFDIRKDVTFLKGEISGIGRRKDKTLTTSENIRVEINKQNAAFIWYRDHVLASTLSAVQTIIILAILYLAFGGKIP
jgi:hypothetical protein